MDSHWRSGHYLFWRRALLGLTAFSLLYFGVVRPLRGVLSTNVVYPVLTSLAEERVDIFQPSSRTTKIVLKDNGDTFGISILFGGYFLIYFVLFWISRAWGLIRLLVYYNSVFTLLYLGVGLLIVLGQGWAIVVYKLLVYLSKTFFYIFLILAFHSLILSKKLE